MRCGWIALRLDGCTRMDSVAWHCDSMDGWEARNAMRMDSVALERCELDG